MHTCCAVDKVSHATSDLAFANVYRKIHPFVQTERKWIQYKTSATFGQQCSLKLQHDDADFLFRIVFLITFQVRPKVPKPDLYLLDKVSLEINGQDICSYSKFDAELFTKSNSSDGLRYSHLANFWFCNENIQSNAILFRKNNIVIRFDISSDTTVFFERPFEISLCSEIGIVRPIVADFCRKKLTFGILRESKTESFSVVSKNKLNVQLLQNQKIEYICVRCYQSVWCEYGEIDGAGKTKQYEKVYLGTGNDNIVPNANNIDLLPDTFDVLAETTIGDVRLHAYLDNSDVIMDSLEFALVSPYEAYYLREITNENTILTSSCSVKNIGVTCFGKEIIRSQSGVFWRNKAPFFKPIQNGIYWLNFNFVFGIHQPTGTRIFTNLEKLNIEFQSEVTCTVLVTYGLLNFISVDSQGYPMKLEAK